MKFCTHCGNFVEGKAFCDKCGKPANVGEAEEIVLTQESVLETDGDIAKSSLKPEENEAAQEEAEAEAIPELNADMPEISHSALPAKNILNACNLPFSDICYCVRVATVANRKIHAQNTTLSGLFSSLSTTVNDVISSTMHNTFLVRTKDGNMQLVCEKMETMKFPIAEVGKRTECGFGFLDFFVTFPQGSIEAVSFKVSSENIDTAVYGNLLQLLYDFGNVSDSSFDRVHNEFMHVFHYRLNIYDNLYPFAAADKTSSLLLFGKDGLYIYGKSRKIEYKNIIAHHCENGYALYLVAENDSLEMFEFSKEAVSAFSESSFNLVRASRSFNTNLKFRAGEESVNARSFLNILRAGKLITVFADGKLYVMQGSRLSECGIFLVGDDVFVKTKDGKTVKYEKAKRITEGISLLECDYDKLISDKTEPQPFVYNGAVTSFTIDDEYIKSETECFYYKKMEKYHYVAEAFNCEITFRYEGRDISLITSNTLGVLISNIQEKMFVSAAISDMSTEELYKVYYKRKDKNFLACTFSEIFKTVKFLNSDYEIKDLIHASLATENAVLRSTFQSILGNFKNIDDLQSVMIQKVTVLEIQRKKIQKICDEWLLYYPHFAATSQVNWLKSVFGTHITKKILKTEYQKCVVFFRRMLASCNDYIQKYMNEIASCINNIYEVLPDDVKRIDVTSSLRINPYSKEKLLSAGSDILVGLSTAIEITNVVTDGVNSVNPLMLSMSVKTVIDSYLKDADVRKDIKAFGLQSLEWWEIFMKGIYIHTLELSNAFRQYSRLCLKRDMELFKGLPQEAREAVEAKLNEALKDSIMSGIEDKFKEILPQFNMRISNVIEEIESNIDFWDNTLDEFKDNLFI